jgi:hypothetical protein
MKFFANLIRNPAALIAQSLKRSEGLVKQLILRRGTSTINYTCANGDKYDSTADLMDSGGEFIFHSEHVNLDHTNNYHGGVLAPGIYGGIACYRSNGLPCIRIYRFGQSVTKPSDLTLDMVTLPSIVPNPNHGGDFKITHVLVHQGGASWDYSHGCLTILNKGGIYDFDRLMDKLSPENNELVTILLK